MLNVNEDLKEGSSNEGYTLLACVGENSVLTIDLEFSFHRFIDPIET